MTLTALANSSSTSALLTRQEWAQKSGVADPVWPPARMTDDELRVWADALLEAGNSYGEYLILRLKLREAHQAGDMTHAIQLFSASEGLFEQYWREWASKLPCAAYSVEASHLLLRDARGLIRGTKINGVKFRDFVENGGAAIYENYGYDELSISGLAESRATDADIALIAKWKLTSLDIYYGKVTVEGAKLLAKMPTLKSLNAGSTRIGDEGAAELLKSTSIESLRIHMNSHTDKALAGIESNNTLKQVDLHSNILTEAGVRSLARNSSITHLNLSNNPSIVGCELLLTQRWLNWQD